MVKGEKLSSLVNDRHCTGCGACANVCSVGALQFIENSEGFYRTSINKDKCVGCLLCEKVCPKDHPFEKKSHKSHDDVVRVWAAWNKKEAIRAESTSGGAFSAIADEVLEQGGYVVAARYGEDLVVAHCISNNREDLPKFRRSKYVQSYIGSTLKEVRNLLEDGMKVLFVGTPCQCAGLKNIIGEERENLLVVDFVCHGVPSPKMLLFYLKWLGNKKNIVEINFRHKIKGWYDSVRKVEFKGNKSTILKGDDDWYKDMFNRGICFQESCYDCKFRGFPRCSDITLGDFWGIGKQKKFGLKKEIDKGISLIIGNSRKGIGVIQKCEGLTLHERSLQEAVSGNPAAVCSPIRPSQRDSFYDDLNNMALKEFVRKYEILSCKERLIKLMRYYVPGFVMKAIRRSLQR